jgi:hypothetical protein
MANHQAASWTPTASGVEIRAPFRPAFRDAMRALPYRERQWQGTHWLVSWACADAALEALRACFPGEDDVGNLREGETHHAQP